MSAIECYFICIAGRIEHYMWEVPIHLDQDGQLISYNLAMIIVFFVFFVFTSLH